MTSENTRQYNICMMVLFHFTGTTRMQDKKMTFNTKLNQILEEKILL